MDSKSDVKAIMARFNTGGTSMEGVSGGRPKAAVHPTLSSGPPVQAKKPVLETSLSGNAASSASTPKPNFLKSTVSTKSAPEMRESPKPKAPVSKFENAQEDGKPPFAKQFPFKPKTSESSQDTEPKIPFPKPPLQKHSLSTTVPDCKPAFPKPPPTVIKPPWLKDSPKTEDCGSSVSPKFPSAPKPKSSLAILKQLTDEGGAVDSAVRPYPGSAVKPSGFRAAQSAFNKDREDARAEDGAKEGSKPFGSNEPSVPKLPASQKPNFIKRPIGPTPQTVNEDSSAPKSNPLPNLFALGTAPAKSNRPPKVNLERFKKGAEPGIDGPGFKKGDTPPPPPAFHPSNHAAPPLPPSLPPRPPGGIIQPDPDDNYDDVAVMNNPPPLPLGGHPGPRPEESGSDEETYEDLDDRWVPKEQDNKKREKEEKKRLEQEKKEQKERDRKEQEVRKKFKLSGPVQVVHKVKARMDCKGGKNDLSVKQGESIEILRISDNPEGRWLGRAQDGSYGYVKTESVEIDFDRLKSQSLSLSGQMDYEPEIYDDVATQDDFNRGINGPGVVLPPPPEEDGDIYDDLDDPNLIGSPSSQDSKSPPKPRGLLRMLKGWEDWRKAPVSSNEVPPPPQFTPEGNADQPIDEEIYDDVDHSQGFPPPPPLSSLPQIKIKPKVEDAKKLKKIEKEEKEFKKKFKFDGEVQVLYQVTIVPTLASKKWSGKDLPLRPGETLDVIVKPEDNKLICRNEEGKFGYVSTSNIAVEDSDIYDDIGDDCIYDND